MLANHCLTHGLVCSVNGGIGFSPVVLVIEDKSDFYTLQLIRSARHGYRSSLTVARCDPYGEADSVQMKGAMWRLLALSLVCLSPTDAAAFPMVELTLESDPADFIGQG